MPEIIQPGTIVKMKGAVWGLHAGAPAITLKHEGNAVRVLADMGIGTAMRHEVAVPRVRLRPFQPMRLRLVYGVWTEQCGSRVLFSRDYLPLWRVTSTGAISPADPWEWIDFSDQQFWWDEADTPWRRAATEQRIERKMREARVSGIPRLMDTLQILVSGEAETIKGAVRHMMPAGQTPHQYLAIAN